MNLYLRLILTLLRCWRLPRLAPGETLTRRLRVLPNDLDINGHMNNGRYLTVIDLMLIEYFVRTGFAGVMLREGWRPMSGGSFISYRRGLKPFQTYELRFRLDATDAQWNYMRFEFASGGKLCAAGYMKGAAVSKQGFVPNAVSYAKMGLDVPSTEVPGQVAHWLAAEREVMAAAW
ncbi:MAG TPA: thioesterase family protein [Rhizobacter sp.]|nr:thioesterase family protein [Rhizobacter sp.]